MTVNSAMVILVSGLVCCSSAGAAGGHHAVDDAAILEAGQCKVDSWLTQARGGERLLHAGTGCRVGPVELGLSADYLRQGRDSETSYGWQAKWAREWLPGLSVGVTLGTGWQARARPRYQGATVAGLLTWEAQENFALHLNLGRDFGHRGADENRYGVAAEWTVRPGWTLMAERYRQEATHALRAGVRWAGSDAWSVDLSRAQRLRGPVHSSWTLGLNWQFDRP